MSISCFTFWRCFLATGLLAALMTVGLPWDRAEARAPGPHSQSAHAAHKRVIHGPNYHPPYAAIVVDDNSGEVLHQENADEPRHPASLTKIMTLYLLFGQIEAGKFKLDTPLHISASEKSRWRQATSSTSLSRITNGGFNVGRASCSQMQRSRIVFTSRRPALAWTTAELAAIERWCRCVPNPRLVVVDVFNKVRTLRGSNESLYDADYRSVVPLKALADDLDLAVVVIHHTNKREDVSDPFDAVSGTTGLTGAADTVLILTRDGMGTTLYGRGRDIAEIEVAMQFDHYTGQWLLLGDASTVRRTDERKAICSGVKVAAGEVALQ